MIMLPVLRGRHGAHGGLAVRLAEAEPEEDHDSAKTVNQAISVV